MIKLYKFKFDCGRQGSLNGIFTEDENLVKLLMESDVEVYFGEVLGKHSEVDGPIDEGEITVLSEDPEFIKKFVETLGSGTVSGFNPFDYLYDDEEECPEWYELLKEYNKK